MTLEESVYQRVLSDEEREQADAIGKEFLANLPHDGDILDLEKVGQLFGDACFGVAGIEATDEARAVFKSALLQTLFQRTMKQAETSPLSSLIKGFIKSQPVSDAALKVITGFTK